MVWYIYVCTDTGSLSLYIGTEGQGFQLWNTTGSAGNYWLSADVNVTVMAAFEFVFLSTTGKYFIAADVYSFIRWNKDRCTEIIELFV